MPYASVRVSRRTRIGGGPVFWLVVGPFIAMGYLLIGAFMLASVVGAGIVALAQSATQRKHPARPVSTRIAARPPQPRDGKTALPGRLSDPRTRNLTIAAWLMVVIIVGLLVAVIVSEARFS